ncbi:MAG: hypothetical protein AABY13_01070, partial [Nanoarchaeota archaeon]
GAHVGGGGGGGGGPSSDVCPESWECTEWSACVDGTQTRTCADKNTCGTGFAKPALTQACEIAPAASCSDGVQNQGESGLDCGGPCTACPTPVPTTPTTPEQPIEEAPGIAPQQAVSLLSVIIGAVTALLLIVLVAGVLVARQTSVHVDEAEQFVLRATALGEEEESIRTKLLSTKWSKGVANHAIAHARIVGGAQYINQELANGRTEDSVRQELGKGGWPAKQLDSAFYQASVENATAYVAQQFAINIAEADVRKELLGRKWPGKEVDAILAAGRVKNAAQYASQRLAAGATPDDITQELTRSGWTVADARTVVRSALQR